MPHVHPGVMSGRHVILEVRNSGDCLPRGGRVLPEVAAHRQQLRQRDIAETTRRGALGLGAAALAATGAGRSRSRPVRFGANRLAWPGFSRAVPLADCARVYENRVNQIPTAWPSVPGAAVLLSIQPWPSDLLAGRLDTRLLAMAAAAPTGSMLTPWYEAGPANPRRYEPRGTRLARRIPAVTIPRSPRPRCRHASATCTGSYSVATCLWGR
jgi:hypothetical protein